MDLVAGLAMSVQKEAVDPSLKAQVHSFIQARRLVLSKQGNAREKLPFYYDPKLHWQMVSDPTTSYNSLSHYISKIESLTDEQRRCYYVFLLFEPATLVTLDQLRLLSGLALKDDDDSEELKENSSSSQKVANIFHDLQAKFMVQRIYDPTTKIHKGYSLSQNLHTAVMEQFQKEGNFREGIRLMVAISKDLVTIDDSDSDQDFDFEQFFRIFVKTSNSQQTDSINENLFEEIFIKNQKVFQVLMAKYPEEIKTLRMGERQQSLLHICCRLGFNFDVITSVVENSMETCFEFDQTGSTPLEIAATCGNYEACKLILDYYPETANLQDRNGLGPFGHASLNNHLEIAQVLYPYCEEAIKHIDLATGQTLLHHSVRTGSADLVRFLIEKWPESVQIRDKFNRTALFYCNKVKNYAILVKEYQQAILTVDSDQRTALSHAAEIGNPEICNFLTNQWPRAVFLTCSSGRTVLSYAAESGNLCCVKFIYEKYPDAIVIADNKGLYPVYYSVKSGNSETISFLFACYPEKLKCVDNLEQRNAFLIACLSKVNEQILQFIVEYDPSQVNQIDCHGRTALSYAVEFSDFKLANFVIQRWKEAGNIADSDGHFPIWYAVMNGHGEMVDFLHSFYPETVTSVDSKNREKSLLILAIEKGFLPIVKLIYSFNPQLLELADCDGVTPLIHAINSQHFEIIKFLCSVHKNGCLERDKRRFGRNLFGIALEVHGTCFEIVKFLYDKWPLMLEETDDNNEIAFQLVERFRVRQNVKELVEEAVQKKDAYGRTAFIRAIVNNDRHVAEIMLERDKESIHLLDRKGKSAMCLAAELGHVEIIEFLHALDEEMVKQIDPNNRTILYLAAQAGQVESIKKLIEIWPEAVEIADIHERTPLMIAEQNDRKSVIEFLKVHLESPPPPEDEEENANE